MHVYNKVCFNLKRLPYKHFAFITNCKWNRTTNVGLQQRAISLSGSPLIYMNRLCDWLIITILENHLSTTRPEISQTCCKLRNLPGRRKLMTGCVSPDEYVKPRQTWCYLSVATGWPRASSKLMSAACSNAVENKWQQACRDIRLKSERDNAVRWRQELFE
jgi:hypothetical protein